MEGVIQSHKHLDLSHAQLNMHCHGGEPEQQEGTGERYIIMPHPSHLKTYHDELQVLLSLKQEKILGKSFKRKHSYESIQ